MSFPSRQAAALLFLFLILVACTPSSHSEELTVFAAASLTDAFEELGMEFEKQHPGVELLFNFAGSATLATQLIEGAPADLFASANPAQMQAVQNADLMAAPPQKFAANRLALIVPADNPAGLTQIGDLATQTLKLVLAAPGVPVREYSDQLIANLGDADFQAAVYANLASEEENVRIVLTKVLLGEADAGIVYSTDMDSQLSDRILSIAIPDQANVFASYPVAALSAAPQPELAAEFIDFLLSAEGQGILTAWGFAPAP